MAGRDVEETVRRALARVPVGRGYMVLKRSKLHSSVEMFLRWGIQGDSLWLFLITILFELIKSLGRGVAVVSLREAARQSRLQRLCLDIALGRWWIYMRLFLGR